jgi:hypothetical protein
MTNIYFRDGAPSNNAVGPKRDPADMASDIRAFVFDISARSLCLLFTSPPGSASAVAPSLRTICHSRSPSCWFLGDYPTIHHADACLNRDVHIIPPPFQTRCHPERSLTRCLTLPHVACAWLSTTEVWGGETVVSAITAHGMETKPLY